MNKIFICNLSAFLFILFSSQIAGAVDPYIELWRYGAEGSDAPPECVEELVFSIYPDGTVGEYCYCKKIVEGETSTYKWCQLDGGECGTSTSCD